MSQRPRRHDNFGRVPLLRAQVRSLRRSAEEAGRAAAGASGTDEVGHILTSNVLAGFALELGLKAFSMTYKDRPARGHDLAALYAALPAQIAGDIRKTYAANVSETPLIKVYAFQISPEQPDVPGLIPDRQYGSADSLFSSASRLFEQARYFFEQPQRGVWATIDHPLHYLIAMSRVLDTVYDEYQRRGGWGASAFES